MRALHLARTTALAWRSVAAGRAPARAPWPPRCASWDAPASSSTAAASETSATVTHAADGAVDTLPALDDHHFMGLALQHAVTAAAAGEVPVGAIVVASDGAILSSAGNAVEASADPTAHAEMVALRAACGVASGWRLTGATLYVTLEPCAMCAGAALLARVGRIVYGARNVAAGADGSWVGVLPRSVDDDDTTLTPPLAPPPPRPHCSHPDVIVTRGVREAECAAVVVDFFRRRREVN